MRLLSTTTWCLMMTTLGIISAHPGHDSEVRPLAAASEMRHCTNKLMKRGTGSPGVRRRAELAMQLRKGGYPVRKSPNLPRGDVSHLSEKSHSLSTPEAIIFATNGFCALSHQATVGNQYVAGEYIRPHVTEGQPGVPLTTLFEVVDYHTCEPVQDVFVEVWSCNATGIYGGVSYNTSTEDDGSNLNNTMLRGVQQTDSEGVVRFETVFPGHYTNRANHIHVMVHPKTAAAADNGTLLDLSFSLVGQVFFDQDLVHEVEALPEYAANKQALMLNKNDGLIKQELAAGYSPFVDYVRLGQRVEDGLLAWFTFGIDTSAKNSAVPAVYLHEKGGTPNPDFKPAV